MVWKAVCLGLSGRCGGRSLVHTESVLKGEVRLSRRAETGGGVGQGAGSRERSLKSQAAVHDGYNRPCLYFTMETLGSYQKASRAVSGLFVRARACCLVVRAGRGRARMAELGRSWSEGCGPGESWSDSEGQSQESALGDPSSVPVLLATFLDGPKGQGGVGWCGTGWWGGGAGRQLWPVEPPAQ